ncbi:MAG: HAD family hydrolase [Elusimicrobiota bacterium]|nr:HAD family hydrolase [Elusimicrobiota bacterium]
MQSLLFDYGGTLDSDGITFLDRLRPIYKEEGLDSPRFERAFYDSEDALPTRHRLEGLDLEQTLRLLNRDILAILAPDRLDRADPISARFAADCRRQFARLKPVLERLSRRYRLGVVSNFYGNLDGILRAEGLRPLFAVVADSGVVGVIKPEPAIFLHACRGVGAAPADCVMVGDSVKRDMAGAAGLGMRRALVSAEAEPPAAGQDWTIRSVVELEKVLA